MPVYQKLGGLTGVRVPASRVSLALLHFQNWSAINMWPASTAGGFIARRKGQGAWHSLMCLGLRCAPIFIAHLLPAQNVITTFAGTEKSFSSITAVPAITAPVAPSRVAVGSNGAVYFGDREANLVLRLNPDGSLIVVAGNGIAGFSGDGGPATSASLNQPSGFAVDAEGNLYIADVGNARVRKVDTHGIISTFAGNGSVGFSGDGGPAIAAQIAFASGLTYTENGHTPAQYGGGICVDNAGNLYIADSNNFRVRMVNAATGVITTVAGNGNSQVSGDGGPATQAGLGSFYGVAIDASGNLYVSSNGIRKVTSNGTISPFFSVNGPVSLALSPSGNLYASTLSQVYVINSSGQGHLLIGGGSALGAILNASFGVAVDQNGNLYIADCFNERILEVDANGAVATVAGTGAPDYFGDGGPATAAGLSAPNTLAIDASGNVYIADSNNQRIRVVNTKGIISTFANLSSLLGADATLYHIALSTDGGVYAIAPPGIVKILPGGSVVTVGGGGLAALSPGASALSVSLSGLLDLSADTLGNIYFLDYTLALWKIDSNGILSQPGGVKSGCSAFLHQCLTVDSGNNVYTPGGTGVLKITTSGSVSQIPVTGLSATSGIAVDSAGNIYLSDVGAHDQVLEVMPGGATVRFAGNNLYGYGGDGGPASQATLFGPVGLALDSSNNLLIADNVNGRIRKVFAQSSSVSYTVAPAAINFPAAVSGGVPVSQSLSLTPSVPGISFSTSVSVPWLSVNPASGAMPASLQVTADPTSLTPGTYQGTVTITAPNGNPSSQTVMVSFTVSAGIPSQLAVSTPSIPFSLTQGGSAQNAQLTISNTGSGSTRYAAVATTISGGNWLQLSGSTSGSVTVGAPVGLTVTASPGTLAPGTYNGTITVTGPDTGQTLTVTVILAITGAPPTIHLTQLGLTFTAISQGGTVLPQTLGILNSGAGTLSYSVQAITQSGGSGWLSVSPAGGTITQPLTEVSFVDVTVNPNQLPPPGTYYGQIVVTASGVSNSPQTALVVLTVLPAGTTEEPDVRPTGLVFIGAVGAENPGSQNITVANVTADPINIYLNATPTYIGTASGWLQYQPTNFGVQPDAPGSINVQPDFSNLTAGEYRAIVTLGFEDGSSQDIRILAVVAPAGTLVSDAASAGDRPRATSACTPTKLLPQFTAAGFNSNLTVGFPAFIAATVVDDCANPMNSGSVTVSFNNGDPPISLISTQSGTWTNSWQPGNPVNNATLTLTANLQSLTGTATETPGAVLQGSQTPPILIGAPLGAGTLAAGPFAPGDLMLLRGTGLADGPASATSSALGNKLAGAQVAIGQAGYVPLLYADTVQVVGLVPATLSTGSQAVVVQRDNALSVQVPVIISTTHPAVLTADGSGAGQGAIYSGNVLANAANPVNSGASIIIYCTGLGATNTSGNASNTPTLTIGGVTAPISYSGVAIPANYPPSGAPTLLGLVSSSLGGLYQITATVPTGLATGAAPVIISSAGQTSQSGVTMMITGTGSNPTQPSIAAGGVLNAASFAKNSQGLGTAVAPGSIVAIFGTFPGAAAASAVSIPYPSSLGGVTVTFNGTPAPIQGVAPGGAYPFITAQVPFEVQTGTAQVVVTVNGQASQPVTAPVIASAPGIFTDPANGEGNAILVYTAANGTATVAAPVNAGLGFATAPIPRGTGGFFYATGLGALTPPVADGAGGIDGTTHEAVLKPVVTIGGVPAQVSYYGPSGYPGVYQINIVVPQSAPTGAAIPLVVTTPDGSVISNTATVSIM